MKKVTVWRCTNCGAENPDPRPTGFWQPYGGGWVHWCHGGRSGKWMLAEEVEERKDERGD